MKEVKTVKLNNSPSEIFQLHFSRPNSQANSTTMILSNSTNLYSISLEKMSEFYV